MKELLENQQSQVNFEFYNTKIPTEVRTVILSETKSILDLKNVGFLPLKKHTFTNSLLLYIMEEKKVEPIENLLNSIRLLLIGYYNLYKIIKINEETAVKIQKDFVKERTKDKNIRINDLHRWISLSKAVACCTKGQKDVSF